MRAAVLALVLALLLCSPALAAEEDALADDLGVDGLEQALPDAARDILGDAGVMESVSDSRGLLQRIWDAASEKLGGAVSAAIGSGASILALALLCALGVSLCGEEGAGRFVTLGGAVAMSAAAAGGLRSFMAVGTETMAALSDFSKALLPTLAAASAATGAAASGAAKYAAASLAVDVLMTAGTNLVLPMTALFVAAATAEAAFGSPALSAASKTISWAARTLLVAMTTLFTAYLTITGLVSGSADALAAKAAKSAISAALPVVGGILSDAAETVLAGAGLIKSAVGVFGLLAVVCVCLVPFLRLGAQYLAFKLAACLAEPMAGGRLAKLISALGDAFGLVLALVGAGGVLLFFIIVIGMRAVA